MAGEADRVPACLRADLVAAATLHDIGYAHPRSGVHALVGAAFLAGEGFSSIVCHLVAHHSASTYEAEERGIDLAQYDSFDVGEDLSVLHGLLAWADMTTGLTVTVEERLEVMRPLWPC